MTITYTIACQTSTGMLIACEKDGADIDAAIQRQEQEAGVEFDRSDITIECGLTLTDDDDGRVVYSGHQMGHLTDSNGKSFMYAVIKRGRKPVPPEDRKDARVGLRVHPDAKATWQAKADAAGLSLAAWIEATLSAAKK